MRVTIVLVMLVIASRADAYPEWQFSSGATRCAECHFSPVGGGLINAYGRDEAATTISGRGDGRFLHGGIELPEWFALGGDVRVASMAKQVRGGQEAAAFPMQTDLYARAAHDGWSINATLGIVAAIRDARPMSERFGSREHYVMYEPESKAWYARAGRMMPAFGLRLPDHTAYVRRYTSLHTLEESYALSGGLVRASWDLHVSMLTPLQLAPEVGRRGPGAALQLERLDDNASIGAHTMVRLLDVATEAWSGATYKRWFESSDLLIANEIDVGLVDSVVRIAAYSALHVRPAKRWGGAIGGQLFDPDLRLRANERVAFDLRGAVFPSAHFEVSLLLRAEAVRTELANGTLLGLLQFHYYL